MALIMEILSETWNEEAKVGKAEQIANVFGTEYDWLGSCLTPSVTNNKVLVTTEEGPHKE